MNRTQMVQKALVAYGAAMRNDWSCIDGRSVRDDMELLSGMLDDNTHSALTYDKLLSLLGVVNGECGYEWE